MTNWFQCKVKFLKEDTNGMMRSQSESYLIDAMTFTEAEARVTENMGDNEKDFTLTSVARSNIKEVVYYGDTTKWYKCKVTYTAMDDESERERKITTYVLVNSETVNDAWDRLHEHLKEMQVPFEVPKIEETPIIEVYEYEPAEKKKKQA